MSDKDVEMVDAEVAPAADQLNSDSNTPPTRTQDSPAAKISTPSPPPSDSNVSESAASHSRAAIAVDAAGSTADSTSVPASVPAATNGRTSKPASSKISRSPAPPDIAKNSENNIGDAPAAAASAPDLDAADTPAAGGASAPAPPASSSTKPVSTPKRASIFDFLPSAASLKPVSTPDPTSIFDFDFFSLPFAANVKPVSTSTAAAATAAAGAAPAPAPAPAAERKPKSTKPRKSRSPSPLPPPPPPLRTVRLVIALGGQDNYEVDVADLARQTGQRNPTPPPPVKRDESDSEEDSEREGAKDKGGEKDGKDPDGEKENKDGEGQGKDGSPKKRGRHKKRNADYDLNDPFIDDSELAIDDRTHFAQTKQQGFYVSSGEVALLKDKSPKKPRSKHPLLMNAPAGASLPSSHASHTQAHASSHQTHSQAQHHPNANTGAGASGSQQPRTPAKQTGAASASATALEGTRESPIALLEDDDIKPPTFTGLKRGASELGSPKSSNNAAAPTSLRVVPPLGAPRSSASSAAAAAAPPITTTLTTGSTTGTSVSNGGSNEPAKKKRRIDASPLHPDLEASIDALKVEIAKASFAVKGKFPPQLKPPLTKLAIEAIVLGEYNDAFFARMPLIFPYNRFTMMKLVKRLVYNDHQKLLQDRQDELLGKLKELADKGFEQAKGEWERNVQNWKERVGRAPGDDDNGDSPPPESTAKDTKEKDKEKDKDGKDKDGKDKALKGKHEDAHDKEPPKKYRLTEEMKKIFWELYCLSNECSRLTNEKNQLEGTGEQVSEQGMRKGLYQKIIAAFPDGWMTSGNISRDISVIKKKMETDPGRYEDYTG